MTSTRNRGREEVLSERILAENLDQRHAVKFRVLNLLLSIIGCTSLVLGDRSLLRGAVEALHTLASNDLAVRLMDAGCIVLIGILLFLPGELGTRLVAPLDRRRPGLAILTRFALTICLGVAPVAVTLEWGGSDTLLLGVAIALTFAGCHVQLDFVMGAVSLMVFGPFVLLAVLAAVGVARWYWNLIAAETSAAEKECAYARSAFKELYPEEERPPPGGRSAFRG